MTVALVIIRSGGKLKKHFFPSSTAAVPNYLARSEKTFMLFLFPIINSLFGVTSSGVFMTRPHTRHFLCACVCEFDLRVPHFLMLSSSAHYPQLRLDTLQGQSCEAMAHIFILPAPLLLLSSVSAFTSLPCMLKLQD